VKRGRNEYNNKMAKDAVGPQDPALNVTMTNPEQAATRA
jgi:hypothetical protein